MKLRKLLLTALCLVGATACFAGFTACQTEQGHEHSYSQAWSYDKDNLDLGHWHECEGEDCNQVSGAGAHTWDNGSVTKTATCIAEGEITYKCTVCQATKTEAVQKVSHSYATVWSKDGTGHWYACTVTGCTTKKDEAEHTFGEWVNDSRSCTVCGYAEAREHTHVYSEEWSKDETGHWHACTVTGCTTKKDEAEHTFGEWVNDSRSCTVCGYAEAREHTHSYATEWSKDSTGHWHVCTVAGCGGKDEVVPHTWNNGEVTKSATCFEEGVKTYTCTACGYTKTETINMIAHAFSTEWSKDETGHWHACTVTGCNGKDTVVPHTYEWASKDSDSHTGTCTVTGCGYETEAEHDFEVTSLNSYAVHTCKDCEEQLAEYEISLITKLVSSYDAYTGSAVKVSLYSIVEGEYVKKYEAVADESTGAATLLVKSGTYQVGIDDPAGYLHNDAPYIKVDLDDINADSRLELVVSESAEYTLKLYYGAGEENPADGVTVKVRPNSSANRDAIPYAKGTTDENGEFKFRLGTDFGARFANGARVEISGYNADDYQYSGSILIHASKETTVEIHLQPKQLDYTVKVKAGEEFVKGATVTFKYAAQEVKSVTMEKDSDTADMGTLDNDSYAIEISGLPAEIEANYKMPNSMYTNSLIGATVIELVKKSPTYVGTISGTELEEKAGIKVLLKDDDGTVAGEGTTDEEGKVYIECPDPEYNYHVCIDKSTMPEGFTYYDTQNVGTYINPQTNTKSSTVTLLATMEMEIEVTGADDVSGITVKLYLNGALAFEGVTNEQGKVTANIPDMQSYKVVLENLPANTVCTTDSFYPWAQYGIINPIQVAQQISYKLTFVDDDGNPIAGATVQFGTLSGVTNGSYFKFTESTNGTTDENGLLDIAYKAGTYALEITGANGEKYYTNTKITGTNGEVVEQITLHFADTSYGYNNIQKFDPSMSLGTAANKTTVISVYSRFDSVLSNDGLAKNKTYRVSILNPDDVQISLMMLIDYDPKAWSYSTVLVKENDVLAEDKDYFRLEKDENGKVIGFTYTSDGTEKTNFQVKISSSSSAISRIAIKVEEVTE